MSREQKLVDVILEDGRKEAEKLVKKAKKQSQQILEEQKVKEEQFFNEQLENLKNEHSFLLESQKQSKNLEKNKIILGVKNEILKQVYDLALKKLKSLTEKEKKSFFEKALSFAENQNEIVVSSDEDKKLVKKLNVFKTKKLKISNDFGSFSGGVVILNGTKEIDFSFDSLLFDKFETKKSDIAKQLF